MYDGCTYDRRQAGQRQDRAAAIWFLNMGLCYGLRLMGIVNSKHFLVGLCIPLSLYL